MSLKFTPQSTASIEYSVLKRILNADSLHGFGAFTLLCLYLTEAQRTGTVTPQLSVEDAAARMGMTSTTGVLAYRKLLKKLNYITDIRIPGLRPICVQLNPLLFDVDMADDLLQMPYWVYEDKFVSCTTPRIAQQAFCLEAFFQYISGTQKNKNIIFVQAAWGHKELGISRLQYDTAKNFLINKKRIEYTVKNYYRTTEEKGSCPYRTETKVKLKFLMTKKTKAKIQASRGALEAPDTVTAKGLHRTGVPTLRKKVVAVPKVKRVRRAKLPKMSAVTIKYLNKDIRFVKKEVRPFIAECKTLLEVDGLPANRKIRIEKRMQEASDYYRSLLSKMKKPGSKNKNRFVPKKESSLPVFSQEQTEVFEFWNAQPNLRSHKLQGTKIVRTFLRTFSEIHTGDFYDGSDEAALLIGNLAVYKNPDDVAQRKEVAGLTTHPGNFEVEEVLACIENMNRIAGDPNTAPWEVKQLKNLGLDTFFWRKNALGVDDLDFSTSEENNATYMFPFLGYLDSDAGHSLDSTIEATIPKDKLKFMMREGAVLAKKLDLDLNVPKNKDMIVNTINTVFPLFGDWRNLGDSQETDRGEYTYKALRKSWTRIVFNLLDSKGLTPSALMHNWFWQDVFMKYLDNHHTLSYNTGRIGRDKTNDVAPEYQAHRERGKLHGVEVSLATQLRFTFSSNGAYTMYPHKEEVWKEVECDIKRVLTSAYELGPVALRELNAELDTLTSKEWEDF